MNIPFHPNTLGPVQPVEPDKVQKQAPTVSVGSGDFAAMLSEAVAARPVRLSAHAQKRLASRGIEPGADILSRLRSAVDRAESKGSRDSLVLIDTLAFIVAIRNRTVVTAFDVEQMKDNVVTNIDSAVIS
jgi:flagellar operon protein